MDHLSANHLLNPSQSAYLKSHSGQTTLFSVHVNIIKAMNMSVQKFTCLCLNIFQLLLTQ